MIVKIKIPSKHFAKAHQEELFEMFRLICDNIDVDGLECVALYRSSEVKENGD